MALILWMNVFRDSTATLCDRIQRLERENARLRHHYRRQSRHAIVTSARVVLREIGIVLWIVATMLLVTMLIGAVIVFCTPIAHA